MRTALSVLIVLVAATALCASAAWADPITYHFTGEWDGSAGTEFSGSVTYDVDWGTRTDSIDETTPGGSSYSYWYRSSGKNMGWSISFGGIGAKRAYGTSATEEAEVVNGIPDGSPTDYFFLSSTDSASSPTTYFEICFQDTTATWLDGNSLPTGISLDDLSGFYSTYVYFEDADGDMFFGEITSISTPEPTTLVLLGVGLAGLALRRSRRRD